MTALLTLTVNGEPRRSAAATIAALVAELGLKPEKVAVERNGTIAWKLLQALAKRLREVSGDGKAT